MSDMTPQRTYDLSKIQSYAGFLQQLFRLQDAKRMTCLPAIVEGFDRASNRATVKPLTQHLVDTLQGELPIDRPSCTVPVLQISRGGWCIDMPLFVGDTGILIALDRASNGAMGNNSTRLWENQDPEDKETVLNEGPRPPDNLIYSSFEYGVFIPFAFGGSGIQLDTDREGRDIAGIVIKRTIDPNPTPEEQQMQSMLPSKERVRPVQIKLNNLGIEVSQGDKTISLNDDGVAASQGMSKVFVNGGQACIEQRYLAEGERECSISVSVNQDGAFISDDNIALKFNKSSLSVVNTSDESAKIGTEFNVVTDVQLVKDGTNYTLQKKIRTERKFGNFIVEVGKESDWI